MLSGLVSGDLITSFVIINIGLFVLGLWCALFVLRKDYFFTPGLIWFWIIIEIINGIGHPLWALYERSYVPGVATAPFLLILAFYLIIQLSNLRIRSS